MFASLTDALNPRLRNRCIIAYETKYIHSKSLSAIILKLILPYYFHLFPLMSHSVCDATVCQFYQLQTSSVVTDVIW